ncbi:MAG: hypothetical protein GC160_25185 [Acidobacteria bacterium]|nr:hypothetical protein [Acidobacteriota bacterium]
MIKAVVLERRHGSVLLKQAALAGTPAGVLTSGALTDGISIARSIKALCIDYEIAAKRFALAVGGEKVICQSDRAPAGAAQDLEGFVRDEAAKQLAYPLSAACIGWQPVEVMIDGAVLWTSTPVEQVDWVRETVSLAGRTAVFVTPQACALANAYSFNSAPTSQETVLLVNIGARCLTLALMRGWAIAYARDMVVTRERLDAQEPLTQRVLKAVESQMSQLEKRALPHKIQKMRLSGGSARIPELQEALTQRLGCPAEAVDPFHKVSYSPSSASGRLIQEHGPSLAIAAGLALSALEES